MSESCVRSVNTHSLHIALAGQPNTGKSTLFNLLTGAKQHVGNWPGKTVEKKTGEFQYNGNPYALTDLPGTYSLSANSAEEIIARNFIIQEKPDLIVVVVDASQLSRSLYLAAEIILLGLPVVIALNMMDIAKKEGIDIHCTMLQNAAGVQIIPMTASKRKGISQLLEAVEKTISEKWSHPEQSLLVNNKQLPLIKNIEKKIAGNLPEGFTAKWVATKLIESDVEVIEMMKRRMDPGNWDLIASLFPDENDGAMSVAQQRYQWIDSILKDAVGYKNDAKKGQIKTNNFDQIATHPFFGSILSAVIILVGLFVTGLIGYATLIIIKPVLWLIPYLKTTTGTTFPILTDFITQAVIPGFYMIMAVASFNFSLMLFLGFLEDVGYLPRLAYLVDIFMTKVGLHGKSFVPLLLGFGCNIAAVMGCRVIETARQRVKAIMIASHIPCPGVMVTTAFMTGVFFGPSTPVIIAAMAAAVGIQIFITAKILDYTFLRGKNVGMVMELPPYHMPDWGTIGNYVWQNYKGFLRKAGTLIAAVTVIVWALSYFPDGQMNNSFLASIGRIFEPAGMIIGMDWRLLTCLLVASISKEAALVSMAVIFGVQVTDGALTSFIVKSSGGVAVVSKDVLGTALSGIISKPSALSFIFAVLFSMPCFATLGAIYYETKSLKWTLGSLFYYTVLSFLWAFAAYRVGLLIFK